MDFGTIGLGFILALQSLTHLGFHLRHGGSISTTDGIEAMYFSRLDGRHLCFD